MLLDQSGMGDLGDLDFLCNQCLAAYGKTCQISHEAGCQIMQRIFFPSFSHLCHLRKKKIIMTLQLEFQLHNITLAKYSQNLSGGSLVAQDPGWHTRQEAEELTRQQLASEPAKIPTSRESFLECYCHCPISREYSDVDRLTFSLEKCIIGKFPDNLNSQLAF